MGSPLIWFGNAAKFLKSQLVIPASTSGNLTVQPSAATTSYTITAPSAQGGSGTVPTNDGSGNLTWSTPSATLGKVVITWELSSGTDSGAATSNAWTIHPFNTSSATAGASWFISLSSNQITLASGTYSIRADIPFFTVGQPMTRIYNITDSSVICTSVVINTTASSSGGNSVIDNWFTLAAQKTLELDYYLQSGASGDSLGRPGNVPSTNEIYGVISIMKIA